MEGCTLADFDSVLEPRYRVVKERWEAQYKKSKAILLDKTIRTLHANLLAVDNAREMEPEWGEPDWKQHRAKIVADLRWETTAPFNRLARVFNTGSILTIPPYFPGDMTELDATYHYESPRTGRYVDQIPLTQWEQIDSIPGLGGN